MRLLIPLVCAALAAAASALSLQAAPPAPPVSQPAVLDVLHKGTTVRLSLDTPLHSGQSPVGEAIRFTVTQEIDGQNGTVLVAKGAPAVGHVTLSTPKGSFGQHGKLVYTIDSVEAVSGVQIPLHLRVEAGSGSGAAAEAAEETDEMEFRPFQDPDFEPDGYVQSAESGGYYFQQKGLSQSMIYDPGRFFGGEDAVVKRGQKYKAKVAKDTPLDSSSY